MAFQITLRDRTVEIVDEADTFAHDKSMTTFYRTGNARRSIDCWSVPVASVRTDEILLIREVADADAIPLERSVAQIGPLSTPE